MRKLLRLKTFGGLSLESDRGSLGGDGDAECRALLAPLARLGALA